MSKEKTILEKIAAIFSNADENKEITAETVVVSTEEKVEETKEQNFEVKLEVGAAVALPSGSYTSNDTGSTFLVYEGIITEIVEAEAPVEEVIEETKEEVKVEEVTDYVKADEFSAVSNRIEKLESVINQLSEVVKTIANSPSEVEVLKRTEAFNTEEKDSNDTNNLKRFFKSDKEYNKYLTLLKAKK